MMYSLIAKYPHGMLKPILAKTLIVPYYHMVSDRDVIHVKHLYPHKRLKAFTDDLEFLLRNYSPVSLLDLLDCLKQGRPLPGKSFLLTFDDGFREMHEIVAPLLKTRGIPAAFFINSAFTDNKELCYQHKASVLAERLRTPRSPGTENEVRRMLAARGVAGDDVVPGILSIPYQRRDILDEVARVMSVDFDDYLQQCRPYLTSGQVRDLIREGFAIGAHSIDHPLYAFLPYEEQVRQTRESMRFVRDTYGLDYGAFAFPHGDRGVPMKFFAELSGAGTIDISFGTSGLLEDAWPRNIQRISFEKPLRFARDIVVYNAVRKMYRTMTGKGKIGREEG